MEISKNQINSFRKWLKNATSIVLVPHKNSDGDAIGSVLGWWNILIKEGFDATVVVPDEVPSNLTWMSGADKIVVYQNDKPKGDLKLKEANLILFLDFNTISRCGDLSDVIKLLKTPKVMIDHHPFPDQELASLQFSNTSVSSTCELSFHLIEAMGWKEKVDVSAAECFYSGIITDTGSLSYNSSHLHTYRVVGQLVEKGIDKEKIHKELFQSNSLNRMKLLGHVLCHNLKVVADFSLAYITISQEELDKHCYRPGDTEGFVNYPLAIKGIDVSALFTEKVKDKFVKISFRSRYDIPVNQYSEQYFSGGGHLNAAGGEWHGTLEEAVERFRKTFPEFLSQL
ncbi:DHH family phosphoesterase [Thermophagus sp. OGC60D27]|uniref:DHH family phosphoesterase n=1 Tax=Thermophagus sp. OGC60D27 TaxID=3458415 RepID=UPI0040380756